MSNPFSQKVLECSKANHAMTMFWLGGRRNSLQTWADTNQRILHLDVNKRSGNDGWFSALLDACRLGEMSDSDYNHLHGFPSRGRTRTDCTDPQCDRFEDRVRTVMGDPSMSWQDAWQCARVEECAECQKERRRRRRVLGCQDVGGLSQAEAAEILGGDRFVDSIFITECNKPVCLYALTRAQHFARNRSQQLLWIQAEDSPPHEHFAHYTRAELVELKAKWLTPTYHARKTEGILSLFPAVYGMPIRTTGGQGAECKACGIHNGTKGYIRAWTLHQADAERLKGNTEAEVVLDHLPLVLWMETSEDLTQQHPDAPHKNWFPLRPVTNLWSLDAAEYIEITRKGFAAVPDFSSTIHVATGRSIRACLPDLGGLQEPPSLSAMMRGCWTLLFQARMMEVSVFCGHC